MAEQHVGLSLFDLILGDLELLVLGERKEGLEGEAVVRESLGQMTAEVFLVLFEVDCLPKDDREGGKDGSILHGTVPLLERLDFAEVCVHILKVGRVDQGLEA